MDKFLNRLRNIFRRLSVQVAVINIILFMLVFGILAAFTFSRSEEAFTTVIGSSIVVRRDAFGNPVFVQQPTVQAVPADQLNIIQFEPDGTKRVVPLDVQFRNRFWESMLSVLVVSLGLSGLGALIISLVVLSPLSKLKNGMTKLREDNYKQELDLDGPAEIENLMLEFNSLAKQLQRVEDMRKDLISDTSHELKTPLAGLKAQLEGVRDGVLELDKKRTGELLKQVNRLDELVESLQSYSRLRGKSLKLNIKKVGLRKLVQSIGNQFEDRLAAAGIHLRLNINSKLTISADEDLLSQIFTNLFENALRYSQASEIVVSASVGKADKNEGSGNVNNESAEIKFEDNGVGIPTDHLPFIFERFYRVEKSRSRETGGLGLGLAIVKEIIEAHGWKIQAESKGEKGKGVSYKISI